MDFGSNDIYIFFPFSLFLNVYVYASVCYFVCIPLLLPFVLGFCLSVFFLWFFFYYLINFFLNNYLNHFILFYLLSFFLFSFYSERCGGQAFGAPARHHGCATAVGEPSSGHWPTRDLPAPCNIKW